ncbi:MAG: hypothetical protein QOI10_2027 [Solirubrobacterales bacterium]|jgi:hypothetical protein|nr:hypothetical protein [Solirubrobacterales bacterium]
MPEAKAAPAAGQDTSEQSSISTEIERSVGTIWQRRDGTRPASVSAKIDGDAISCAIEEGEAVAEETPSEEQPEGGGTDSNAYRHEASAAVARITGRTVSAFIAKRDKKTGVATQTFILERNRRKY